MVYFINQIVVEKIDEMIEPFDSKVSKTIENIIGQFFQKTDNSILYVCSNADNKERKRFAIVFKY